jgi:hypothetical protein
MEFNKFDRLKLKEDFEGNQTIAKGTVVTLREFLNNNICLIQYGYEDEPLYAGVPKDLLVKAIIEDLNNVSDYKNLVPTAFHVGSCYDINNNNDKQKRCTITGVQLSLNEKRDQFKVIYNSGEPNTLSNEYLDEYGSHIGYKKSINTNQSSIEDNKDIEKDTEDNKEELNRAKKKLKEAKDTKDDVDDFSKVQSQNKETKCKCGSCEDSKDKDIIEIKVNGIKFIVEDNNITIPNISISELSNLNTAINKISKLLGGE